MNCWKAKICNLHNSKLSRMVTYQANVSKHTMTMEQLYEFCNKVINHANQQPSASLTTCEGSETNG